MVEEKTLSSQLIYEGRAVKLRIDTVRMPGGRETTREIVEHSDCVAIIAVDANKVGTRYISGLERGYRKVGTSTSSSRR